jgi:DNA-binding CsgD family transcriptional regulator
MLVTVPTPRMTAYPRFEGVRDQPDCAILASVDLQERMRRLAAAGGNLSSVRIGLDRALRLSVAYSAASIATVDPATMLWTSCFVSGLPPGGEAERERVIYQLEFAGDDFNGYAELATSGVLVGRLYRATGGDLTRAKRWEPLLSRFDVTDEMRVILVSGGMAWGTLTLYRQGSHPPFSDRDETVVRSALIAMADVLRLAMLRAAIESPSGIDRPPGLVLVSPAGEITTMSDAARGWLDTIDDRDRIPSALRSVAAKATAGDGLASAILPAPAGQWVVLHASTLAGDDAGVGVIIEGARPVTLSKVIAGAYGLTPREQDITALAAQGRSTKQMALALDISPFTVQDHLKAVFAKVGVQSRAELVATLYVRHYEPHRGATPGPYGWYLDDNVAAV